MVRHIEKRAASSAIAVILMVALTIILAVSVSVWFFALADDRTGEAPPITDVNSAAFLDPSTSTITLSLTHHTGENLDVSALKLIVAVDNKSATATGFPISDTNIRSATLSGDTEMLASGPNTAGGSLSTVTDDDPRTWAGGEPLLVQLNASNIPSTDTVSVTIVHQPSDGVLERVTVPIVGLEQSGGETTAALSGSIHTTKVEFNAGNQSGFTIDGSGRAASLNYTYQRGGLDFVYISSTSNGTHHLKLRDTKTGEQAILASNLGQDTDIGRIGGLGDIDADGDLDVLYRHEGNYDDLRYVDGLGNHGNMGVKPGPIGDVDDFDHDGDRDALFTETEDQYHFMYVDMAGHITELTPMPNHLGGTGDIDGDGDSDTLYVDWGKLRYVDGSGNVVDTGYNADDVGPVGDYDGDGKMEAFYINGTDFTTNHHLKYVHFTASGGIDRITTLAPANLLTADAITDIDGDGDLDVAYAHNESGGRYRLNGALKYVDLGGNVTEMGFKAPLGSNVGQFGGRHYASYVSANHTLANQSSGFVNATLQDASLTATWQYYNASNGTWETFANATYTNSGTHRVSFNETSQPVRVKIYVQAQTKDAVAKIHAEGTQT